MSLNSAQTLSLLQSILREQPVAAQENRRTNTADFSNRLDKALERGTIPESVSPDSLLKAAEALRLETLRSSMQLLDDKADGVTTGLMPLPPAQTPNNLTMQAYISNLPPQETTASKSVKPSQPLPEVGPQPLQKLSLLGDTEKTGKTNIDPIIMKASRQYGVDPALIRAVIKAESNFNPRAVSHAGAQGLMQLMPGTARGLGVSDSFNPEQNIMAGTRFLKGLLDRYNNDIDSALAAYNWGPGNVDRKPDRLPRETRDYIAKVKQYYTSFQA